MWRIYMNDLDNVSFEELKKEYLKRLEIRRKQKKEMIRTRPRCHNCAHRIWGKVFGSGSTNHETWVCEKKPKNMHRFVYGTYVLPYMQAYMSCLTQHEDCEMFVHKDSEQGQKIIRKRSSMADRIADDDFTR